MSTSMVKTLNPMDEVAIQEMVARAPIVRAGVLRIPELVANIMAHMDPEDVIKSRNISKIWNAQYVGSTAVRTAAASPEGTLFGIVLGDYTKLANFLRFSTGGRMPWKQTVLRPAMRFTFKATSIRTNSQTGLVTIETAPVTRHVSQFLPSLEGTEKEIEFDPNEFISRPRYRELELDVIHFPHGDALEALGYRRETIRQFYTPFPKVRSGCHQSLLTRKIYRAEGIRIKDFLDAAQEMEDQAMSELVEWCEAYEKSMP